jgi:hypothetical protein
LYGNYANNKIWDNPDINLSEDKGSNYLQNAVSWNGFGTTGAGGSEFGEPFDELRFDKVYAHGFGSNTLNVAGDIEVNGDKIVTGNSVRNHAFYGVGAGTVKNTTLFGYAWEVHSRIGTKTDKETLFENLRYRAYSSNPEGLKDGNPIINTLGQNVTIDGFDFDLSGLDGSFGVWTDRSTNNVMKNGTVRTPTSGTLRLYTLPASRSIDVPEETVFKNFTVYEEGTGHIRLIRGGRAINHKIEGFTIQAANGADTGFAAPWILISQSPKFRDTLDVPPRNVVSNLDHQHNLTKPIKFGGNPSNFSGDPFPREQFIKDSQIQNVGADLWKDDGRLGIGDLDANLRAQRIYFDNVTLNVPDAVGNNGGNFHGIMGGDDPREMFRMRGCQDREGRVSEVENQTYTTGQSEEGQDYVEIPTSLLSYPHSRQATVTSGGNNISSVTGTNVVGRSDPEFRIALSDEHRDPTVRINFDGTIKQGETIEIEYSFYVTPPEDYQTTGLFVSRPVYDKNYASGNGPFTVDLRGVAVSQESRDKVVYTASSGDASVVTANVQDDDYTLELTEQGTGTATITVTAEIEGVGTTTTTFEVTIE